MWDNILFILLLTGYVIGTYVIIKLIKKHITGLNKYIQLLVLSFAYALLWGIGIAGSGGDPGFAFPAPNVLALALMVSIDFYRGVRMGLLFLAFWWLGIFLTMYIAQLVRNRKNNQKHNQLLMQQRSNKKVGNTP